MNTEDEINIDGVQCEVVKLPWRNSWRIWHGHMFLAQDATRERAIECARLVIEGRKTARRVFYREDDVEK